MKPRKSEKKQSKSSPLRLRGRQEMLLARWTDGLFYFVKITKVSEANRTCMVEFEDKSVASVHFKDLLEEKEEGVTMCHCCGKEEAEDSDSLVKCDNCDRDYHLCCHIPAVSASESKEDKFVCRICVFTSCAQAGGAKKTGPHAAKYAEMRQHFPYDIKYLTWNATHTSNVEQCFCYCGGPGIWYNKMLQCCRCRQWFHEACIQCLDEDLLIGDRFFIFACAHCNYGQEFLQRPDLTWYDITYITLFHLIMTMGKRYIDLESDIVPLIMKRAHTFGLKKLLNGLHGCFDAICSELIRVLHKNNSVFCCGSEVKKRCTFYGIRERIPPCPPAVSIPAPEEVITAENLASNYGKRVVFTPSKFTIQVPYVLRGSNRVIPPTMGAKLRESKLAKIARVKSEHNYCTPVKCLDDSLTRRLSKIGGPSWEAYDANNNSPSTHHTLKVELDITEESDAASSSHHEEGFNLNVTSPTVTEPESTFWSLDTAFPEPDNFTGANHPFLTEFEQENLRKQREHFENQLSILSELLLEDDEEKHVKGAHPVLSPLGTPPSAIKDVKGFKGELADLINSTCGSAASTPKKSKSPPNKAELSMKEEKLFDKLEPPKNGVLSRRNRLHHQVNKERKVAANLSPCCINGVKISPNLGRIPLKNGISYIKCEPSTSTDDKCEAMLDKAAQKRLRALKKCLKNLTPTCGFRFPVLEETHPAVINNIVGPVICNISENKRLPSGMSTSSLPVGSNSKLVPSSLSKSGKRGRKRKLEPVEFHRKESIKDQCSWGAENVRRSHRSRSIVQKFDAATSSRNNELDGKMGSINCGLVDGEMYDVISLRIRPESGLVEYLVNWSQ